MRRYVGWSGAVALVVSSVIALSGCGGGGGSNSTDQAPEERTEPFVLDPVGTTSNAGSMTLGVSDDAIDGNGADRITVFARLLDSDRRPLGGRAVYFQTDFPDAGFEPFQESILNPACNPGFPCVRGITDGSGLAFVTLVAPATPGRMAVVAFTERNLRLSALAFVTVFDVGFVPTDGVVVIPSEIVMTDPSPGENLQFVVVGGTPFSTNSSTFADAIDAGADLESVEQSSLPYNLLNASSGIGVAEMTFTGTFPARINYTVSGRVAGNHTFSVVDAAGSTATGGVTVEFTELTISPESAAIEVEQTQAFSISGGVPPYTCTPSGGTLTPTTVTTRGGTTVFTPNEILREGTFTILCSDQAGQTVSASVMITPLPTATPAPSGAPPPTTPTPSPQPEAARVEVFAVPPTLNGPDGGTSTITARVLDQSFNPLPGIPVIFTLVGAGGDPTPTVPSINPTTSVSDGNGQAAITLTVPEGTAPQFLVVSAETDNGKTGQVQVGVTSQTTTPGGDPSRISAAILRSDACQLNQDGTYTAIVSALVSDDNGNPVTTGVAVNWGPVTPAAFADVIGQSFTNAEVPCNVSQYKAGCEDGGALLAISPQPGTATTCFTYAASRGGQIATVTATVEGTSISTTTSFQMPAPAVPPAPTPAPPVVTPTPGAPSLVPGSATLDVGQTQVFAVSGGVPPYSVNASGGTATPTTVPGSGGTFDYVATTAGNFTILVSDSNGQVASASITNLPAVAIQVDKPGPLAVGFGGTESITITGGGTPPYTITLSGGLGGSITGSPLPGPGTFDYNAPGVASSGSILITDSAAGTPNTLSITVSVP